VRPARRVLAVVAVVAAMALLVPAPASAGAPSRRLVAPASVGVVAGLVRPVPCPRCWHPALRTSWQWQLASPPSAAQVARNTLAMWDVDGFDTPASTVRALHRRSRVVCYVSAGSFEAWRPDARAFPGAAALTSHTPPNATVGLLGHKLAGWDERWLDIREIGRTGSRLRAIMTARVRMCRAKGFDAVEFDNVDGYRADTGWPLTAADQLRYNVFLANTAHANGLSAVLKNDIEQIPALLPYFDMALNEQCWQFSECTTAQNGSYGYDQFVRARKAVFGVEYALAVSAFCSKANARNFNWLRKHLLLDPYRVACR
jgi:hypothetical protein